MDRQKALFKPSPSTFLGVMLVAGGLWAPTSIASGQTVSTCPKLVIVDATVRTAPSVVHFSDTVDLNQIIQVFGDSMNSAGYQVSAKGWSIPDSSVTVPGVAPTFNTNAGTCLSIESATATTAKVLLPNSSSHTSEAGPKLGLYAFQLSNSTGASSLEFLNRAEPWWVIGSVNDSSGSIYPSNQGGTGDKLIPGQVFRVFGRNLFASTQMQGWLQGNGLTCPLAYQLSGSNDYSASYKLPLSCGLKPGTYSLVLHNGLGGVFGFGKGLTVVVGQQPTSWSSTVFDVTSAKYGATGDGVSDDTVAFQAAIADAAANGGGRIEIPAGSYRVGSALVLPQFVQFVGTGTDQTKVILQSTENGGASVIAGNGNFNVQNLTIKTSTAHRVITCPAVANMYDDYGVDQPYPQPCSNVLIDHVTIAQTTPSASFSPGAHDGLGAIFTFGPDVTIQNSTISALASTATDLWYAHHVVLLNNSIYNGDIEHDGFINADQTIYEGSSHQATPGSSGGAVFVQGRSHYMYFGNNLVQNSLGTFGEGFVAGDTPYSADWVGVPTAFHLGTDLVADPPTISVGSAAWKTNQLVGEAVYVVSGKGALQRNYVSANSGNVMTLANLWQVPLDSSSIIDVVGDHSEGIFYGNTFRNVSVAIELYTQSYGFIIDSNTVTDGGGSYCLGWNGITTDSFFSASAAALNVCYFNQWTNNRISGSLNDPTNPNTNVLANTAVLGPILDPQMMTSPNPILGWIPAIVGNEIRGNSLTAVASGVGSGFAVIGGVYNNGQNPMVCSSTLMPDGGGTDTLVESNTISGSQTPIQFWTLFGNTTLWNNSMGGGSPQNLGFDLCTSRIHITTPAPAASVSGSNVSMTATVQTQSGATITSVRYYIDGALSGTPSLALPFQSILDSTLLANGTHYAIATVTDTLGAKGQSTPLIFQVNNSATLQPATPKGTALITGFNPGLIRNNYTGWVGAELVVGSSPMSVMALGRMVLPGNAASHMLKIVQTSTGIDVPGASVEVSLAAGTAGQFSYVQLPNPITLSANTSYHLVSQEELGGDQWYNIGTVSSTSDANILGPIYWDGYRYVLVAATPGQSYVPINVIYTLASGASQPPPPQATPMITSFNPGRVRSDYSGWVGSEIAVGSLPITVTSLGRIILPNSQAIHTVKLVRSIDGTDVPGGSVDISAAAGKPGQYMYVDLSAPITLPANGRYQLVSQEYENGDQWYDVGTVSTTTDAAIAGPVYWDSHNFITVGGLPGQSYVPLNILYFPASQTSSAVTTPNQWIVNSTPGLPRNSYSGWVGTQFTVGSAPLTVASLGRMYVAGNIGTHIVKLVSASTGLDVPGGAVSVPMISGSSGQFASAQLQKPITLADGSSYYLVSQETAGGDQFFDAGQVSTTSVANVIGPVYWDGRSFFPVAGYAGKVYGPVSLFYK